MLYVYILTIFTLNEQFYKIAVTIIYTYRIFDSFDPEI